MSKVETGKTHQETRVAITEAVNTDLDLDIRKKLKIQVYGKRNNRPDYTNIRK